MTKPTFTGYDKFIIAILTIIQFTIILDFMVLSPLGAFLMPALDITPRQFGMVVSAYAFSAFASGILAAGFADRFDRKKMLLFFYTGFVIGTLLCGIAPSYEFLLGARIITGLFGGVIGSIVFAIVTDLFRVEVRGTIMGFLQMAFAGAQVLGLPVGVKFTEIWGWHMPFLIIVGLSVIVGVLIAVYMKPVNTHLQLANDHHAFRHITKTLSNSAYRKSFFATMLLATGGFMLMPFASAYSVNNLGILQSELWVLYAITGIFSMALGPMIGKLSDRVGKYRVFVAGTILTIFVVLYYCNLPTATFWLVAGISVVMFAGVSARMITSQALVSIVPAPADRGVFMAVNTSTQQLAGGISTMIAGLIIVEAPSGKLLHYDILGYVVSGIMILTIAMMYWLHWYVKEKLRENSNGKPMQPSVAAAQETVRR